MSKIWTKSPLSVKIASTIVMLFILTVAYAAPEAAAMIAVELTIIWAVLRLVIWVLLDDFSTKPK